MSKAATRQFERRYIDRIAANPLWERNRKMQNEAGNDAKQSTLHYAVEMETEMRMASDDHLLTHHHNRLLVCNASNAVHKYINIPRASPFALVPVSLRTLDESLSVLCRELSGWCLVTHFRPLAGDLYQFCASFSFLLVYLHNVVHHCSLGYPL